MEVREDLTHVISYQDGDVELAFRYSEWRWHVQAYLKLNLNCEVGEVLQHDVGFLPLSRRWPS